MTLRALLKELMPFQKLKANIPGSVSGNPWIRGSLLAPMWCSNDCTQAFQAISLPADVLYSILQHNIQGQGKHGGVKMPMRARLLQ